MKRLTLWIILAGVLSAVGQAAADPSAPVTCPDTIMAPGQYRLAADCAGSGILIFVSDVHLKLDGHTMTGPGNFGVGALAVSNVYIDGPGTITGYQLGIDLSHVTNSHVVGVTCVANNAEGLFIEESSGNQIVNNVADGNGINGIFLTPSSKGNHIDGNVANANVFAGIHVDAGATDNQVHGNGAFGNGSGDDLRDDNPGCDDNNWNGNHFATSNQTCIH